MKYLLKVTLLVIAFLNVQKASSQSGPAITFEEKEYDFREIREESGPVEHTFVFTNTGDAPLVIKGVKASCGCTTPSWSKDPIGPGAKGELTARYNPKNRPGPFRKSLTVTSNAVKPRMAVYITGSVKPKPKSPADYYPIKIGSVRFKYRSMHMGRLTTEGPVSKKFDIYNDGDQPVSFLDSIIAPDYVKISFEPATIPPKSDGSLIVWYDAKAKDDLGFMLD